MENRILLFETIMVLRFVHNTASHKGATRDIIAKLIQCLRFS